MAVRTVLFGSIGVLAETSDIQRRAYNQALSEHDVPWQWDEATYRTLLTMSGGRKRLRMLADATGTDLDDETIASIHTRKTEIATDEVRSTPASLRPGVAELIERALATGIQLGLVTSTYRPNVDAIADAAGTSLPLDRFSVVVTKDDVTRGKPAPDVYELALRETNTAPEEAVAIEDTATSTLAAVGAGVATIVTPGRFTDGQIVVGAHDVIASLAEDDGSLHPTVVAAVFG